MITCTGKLKSFAFAIVIVLSQGVHAADHPGLKSARPPAEGPPIEGTAAQHSQVSYLDDSRDTLTYGGIGGTRDYELLYRSRLHLWVPPGDGPFPCLIYVHGGGYGTGHSDRFSLWNEGPHDGTQVDPRELGISKGYVLVTLNYILGGDGIHPQVQRDFKEAVRFLRANREQYKIDPNRIGAVGSSAGGWLITSGGLTTADDFGYRSQGGFSLADLLGDPRAWRRDYDRGRSKEGQTLLFTSYDEAEPRHPAISSRLSALAFDFSHMFGAVTPDDPAMLSVAGDVKRWWDRIGGRAPDRGLLERKLTLIDFGKHNPDLREHGSLHVPPHNVPVDSADGRGTVPAVERVFQFFDRELKGPDARTPAAEARPNRRFFGDSVRVTFATAAPGTAVHYTLDGSDPTPASPVADGAVELTETTAVKFIAVAEGMKPSGVSTATFIKGDPLPRVTEPDVRTLPIATAGQPYEVRFRAAGATRWHFKLGNPGNKRHNEIKKEQGHDVFNTLRDRNHNLFMIGLDCDPKTGRLFGTPDHPGIYVLQVATADGEYRPAACRTYTLVVLPEGTEP